MAASCDTVIIGGAALGSAVAYFLSENADYDGAIVVIEPDPTYATASTTLSGASVRQQFSNPINIAISQFFTEFTADFHANVAVGGEAPDLGFRETGYLFLATEDGLPVLRENHRVQTTAGADVVLLSPGELAARFPYLNVDDLAGASLGLRGEGSLDAYSLMQGFRGRARSNGVEYVQDKVVGFEQAGGGRIERVRLASGAGFACRTVVNCAGPAAADVAALAGVDLPVEPRKRCVFVFDAADPPIGHFPLIVDPSGVWVRSEPPHFMASVPPPNDEAVPLDDFAVRRSLFDEYIWPVLAARIPQFEALLVTHSWAGHYAYNTFDQNAIVGFAGDVPNLVLANGFSGHGMQQAPAVGRGVSELVTYGAYRTLDLTPLGYERIVSGRPFREAAVI